MSSESQTSSPTQLPNPGTSGSVPSTAMSERSADADGDPPSRTGAPPLTTQWAGPAAISPSRREARPSHQLPRQQVRSRAEREAGRDRAGRDDNGIGPVIGDGMGALAGTFIALLTLLVPLASVISDRDPGGRHPDAPWLPGRSAAVSAPLSGAATGTAALRTSARSGP